MQNWEIVFASYSLTGLSTGLNRVESTKWVATAGDVGVTPELRGGQLEHVLEAFVSSELTGEGEAGEAAVVPDVGVGTLQWVTEGVAIHAKLVGNNHHVKHCVPIRVLGVRIGSL